MVFHISGHFKLCLLLWFRTFVFPSVKKSLEKMCLQTSSLGGEGREEILGISRGGSVLLWWKRQAIAISLMPNWETAQGSSATSTRVPKSSNLPNLYPTSYHPASNLIFPDLCVPRPFNPWSVCSSSIDVFSLPGHPRLLRLCLEAFSSTVSWILIYKFPISVYIQILFHLCIHPMNLPPHSKSLCL